MCQDISAPTRRVDDDGGEIIFERFYPRLALQKLGREGRENCDLAHDGHIELLCCANVPTGSVPASGRPDKGDIKHLSGLTKYYIWIDRMTWFCSFIFTASLRTRDWDFQNFTGFAARWIAVRVLDANVYLTFQGAGYLYLWQFCPKGQAVLVSRPAMENALPGDILPSLMGAGFTTLLEFRGGGHAQSAESGTGPVFP